MRRVFVTGIGTGIGKTVASAIITEALHADYWKPIQAGNLDYSDSDTVRDLISNKTSRVHPEHYRLTSPMSPDAAAQRDGVILSLSAMYPPGCKGDLVIEGCGGLLVPLNNSELVIDMVSHFACEVVLVSQFYLGSINHTLLSLEALARRSLPVRVIFNGPYNADSAASISLFGKVPVLAAIPQESKVTREFVARQAANLRESLEK